MTKHISTNFMYALPSGANVHPCRLIRKDGTLMWKHALLHGDELNLPSTHAEEAHIVKTAQRLEELNSWASIGLEPWECIVPIAWYVPSIPELSTGISAYFKHFYHDISSTYSLLESHVQDHETLELRGRYLFFRRC